MTPQIPGYLIAFESTFRPLVAAIALGLIWMGAARMQAPAKSDYATAGVLSAAVIALSFSRGTPCTRGCVEIASTAASSRASQSGESAGTPPGALVQASVPATSAAVHDVVERSNR